MTKEKYKDTHIYVGKHEPKDYVVWRVLGPAGPEEYFVVTGFDNAKQAIIGCWDWEIKRADTMEPVC